MIDYTVKFAKPSTFTLSPRNVRKSKVREKLERLVDSASALGVVRPVIVNKKNEVIAGQRRWLAALELEKKGRDIKIPYYITTTDNEAIEIILSFIENYLHEPVETKDIASGLKSLREEFKYTYAKLSEIFGIPISTLESLEASYTPPVTLTEEEKKVVEPKLEGMSTTQRRLFHRAARLKPYKNNVVAQVELMDKIQRVPTKVTEELIKKAKKGEEIDIKRTEDIAVKPETYEFRTFRFKKEWNDESTKRTVRERKDSEAVIERLWFLWGTYKFCSECDKLVES